MGRLLKQVWCGSSPQLTSCVVVVWLVFFFFLNHTGCQGFVDFLNSKQINFLTVFLSTGSSDFQIPDAKNKRTLLTLFKNPFNTWEALTERNLGIRIGFSRITVTGLKTIILVGFLLFYDIDHYFNTKHCIVQICYPLENGNI